MTSSNRFKKIYPAFFFFVLSILLIISWFRSGLLYGGGDVGLPVYDPQRISEITKYIWWESAAPGYSVPNSNTTLPLQLFLSLFQQLGFGPVALQATLFFILLFLMGYGAYLLSRYLLGKNKNLLSILAGIFYLFNPYMMIQIWHRFIHTSIFLAAALPFLILFWLLWIRNGKFKYLFLFLLTNLLGIYLYGTIAFILTIWLIILLLTFFDAVIPWRGRDFSLKIVFRFLTGFIFWLVVNSWWLVPLFAIGPNIFEGQHTTDESLVTLINISKQTVVPFSLQLINPFYLFYQADFGDIYKSAFMRSIPWLMVSLIILGLFTSLKRKGVSILAYIYIILFFLAKGASEPFGFLYKAAFNNFFFLGVIRNPFEKLGILLPFFSAIFFVLGVETLYLVIKKKLGKSLSLAILLILVVPFTYFCWPFFSGELFGRADSRPYVKVPQSYTEADNWLNDQKKGGKILHLPLTRAEDSSYKWEYSYSGVEPSSLLFTSNPSISRGFNIKAIDNSLTALSLIFAKEENIDEDQILNLLQAFDIKFIVLHKDQKWEGKDTYDPLISERILDNLGFLNKKSIFGDLSIYELTEDSYKPRIVLFDFPILAYPKDNIESSVWHSKKTGLAIVSPKDQSDMDLLRSKSSKVIIYPENSFEVGGNVDISFITSLEQVHVGLEDSGEVSAANLVSQIIAANSQLNNLKDSKSGLNNYFEQLKSIFYKEIEHSRLFIYVDKKKIGNMFLSHLAILNGLPSSKNIEKAQINEATGYLNDKLNQNHLKSVYVQDTSGYQKIFHFQINDDNDYRILMDNEELGAFRSFKNLKLKVNNEVINLNPKMVGRIIYLGDTKLSKGFYELSYDQEFSDNLLPDLNKWQKLGNTKVGQDNVVKMLALSLSSIEGTVDSQGGDQFRISFETVAPLGGFYLQIFQDG